MIKIILVLKVCLIYMLSLECVVNKIRTMGSAQRPWLFDDPEGAKGDKGESAFTFL